MKDKKYSELLVISNIKKTILYFDNILINFRAQSNLVLQLINK